MLTQRPRGTVDLFGERMEVWRRLEAVVHDTFRAYHYQEIRTPVFEHTELFERGVGETTDIVEKEMYTFLDRGERSLTLRPEGTAGVVRAYVENKLYANPGVAKLYYIGPMFRYEKPQKGRERQFHQYGCEVLGTESPYIDAEVIALNVDTLTRFGLTGLTVELNSVGCPECRPQHKVRMLEALRPYADQLCSDCQRRLERNPLRIFDCKKGCRDLLARAGAPTILDALCAACADHFGQVRAVLAAMQVPYVVNEHLVRGLDYYTRTAWEVTAPEIGTVGGGGRYNGLVAELGGPATPGIGFAVGMERAILLHELQHGPAQAQDTMDLFIAVADASAEAMAMQLLQAVRREGYVADRDYQGRGLKAQLKLADRAGARFVGILGGDEVARGRVTLKNMATGEQTQVAPEDLPGVLRATHGQAATS